RIKPTPCLMAVGVIPAGETDVEDKLICLADLVEDQNTIQERAGCGMALYDLKTHKYRAGESNLTIAKAPKTCAEGGLEQIQPKAFVDYATSDGRHTVVLDSSAGRYRKWWEDLESKAAAQNRVTDQVAEKCSAVLTLSRGRGKDWVYDRKSTIEKGSVHAIVTHEYSDKSPECKAWRASHHLGENPDAAPAKH
ncbi:MAG TPA: hypothetical protein VL588_02060, partial [Bdellovibrionota bacterium]|nr:hypothetical protein [Bdellovibrionota bacterium]